MRLFIIVFLLGVFSMGIVVMRMEINRSGRAIGRLNNEVEIKEARNQYLQLEISRLASPSNIHKVATEKLKLEPAKPQQIVVLD